jgi:hypothetical protein
MQVRHSFFVLNVLFCLSAILPAKGATVAEQLRVHDDMTVAMGWHPWYEIKRDLEDSNNLIICGSRWDAGQNTLQGFVYASFDGGSSWKKVFEDKNSGWVSEQSCAFGAKHKAYFVSEASKVVDGEPSHHQGTTRIFTSADAGRHWAETAHCAWADWSTSAASSLTGNLFTFFNDSDTADQSKNWGSSVGLLEVSPDGRSISGPFVAPAMRELNYQGVFPSNAVVLRDRTVIALYFGFRGSQSSKEFDVGVERVDPSPVPSPSFTLIASSPAGKCLGLADYSLSYNDKSNRLFVVYHDRIGDGCPLVLTTSDDNGKTWTKAISITGSKGEYVPMFHPSIAAQDDGQLGLLWEGETKKWLFARAKNAVLTGAPVEVLDEGKGRGVTTDSLLTVFYHPGGYVPEEFGLEPSVGLSVRTTPGRIWRSSGLVLSGDQFHAAFVAVEGNGNILRAATISPAASGAQVSDTAVSGSGSQAIVTSQVKLLYGRAQSFDNASGILSLEVRIANRGDRPLRTPILLEVKSVSSKVGKVRILNADNGLPGAGAVWDLSRIVAGDQVIPGATTYSTFTLLFHIDLEHPGIVVTNDLLSLAARIVTPSGG